MLIIDFNSFVLYIKLFFIFYIINKQIKIHFKKNLIYYIIIDSINNLIIKLFMLHNNQQLNLFYFFFFNFGMLFSFWQLYSFYSIFSIIINKKIKSRYHLIFFTFICSVIKIIIKIMFYINQNYFLQRIHIINQSKILFFFTFISYLLFQLYYTIPIIIQNGIYLKSYKINQSLKKSLYLLFTIFLIKIIIDFFQVGFLEFFKIFLDSNTHIRKLVAKDSDTLFIMMSLFSIIIYFVIVYFIKKLHNITTKNYNYSYLKKKTDYSFAIAINKENIERILIENNPLKNLIYQCSIQNIKDKYNLTDKMFTIINKNNPQYKLFFQQESFFYEIITINQLIYYDEYYDIYNANLLIEDNISIKNKLIKNILDLLDEFNIRLIIPILKNNVIENYLIIFQNTLLIKNNFNELDFKYFFTFIKYINDCEIHLKSNSFYSKLIYENKIATLNMQENNEIHEKNYIKLNEKIDQIEQVFIYENNKNNIKCFAKKSSSFINEFLQYIHKNKTIEDKFIPDQNFIFKKNKYSDHAILSNEKIHLNSFNASLYTIFPFFKKENDRITLLLDNEKINTLFPLECNILDSHRFFFNTFYNDFSIKIIIFCNNNPNTFFKIISYIAQAECIFISLNNITNFKSFSEVFNNLIISEKKYYLFFTHINSALFDFQKHIMEIYLNHVITKKNIVIKIFFILEEKYLSCIHDQIISVAKIITLQQIIIKNIPKNNLKIILKNYSDYLLKKNYSIDNIEKIIDDYYIEKSNNNLYLFFEFFEKIIEIYSSEKININNTDNFYINEAAKLEKEALKNIFLMEKIGNLYNFNYEKIAKLLNSNKAAIIKYYKNNFEN